MSDFILFWQQSPRNRKSDLVRAFRSLRPSLSTMHAGSHDDEEVRKEEMHTNELLNSTCVTECDQTSRINSAGRNVADWECIQVKSEPV